MKQITIILLLLVGSYFSYSQNKLSGGIYAEGGYFMPKGSVTLNNGFSTGGGLYAAYPLGRMFSLQLGAGYRYKTNKQKYSIPIDSNEDYEYTYGFEYKTESLPQHYFTVPLKLQFSPINKFFLELGIEGAWLLNYDVVDEKPEYNWIVGAGYQITPAFKASLNYTQGGADQGFGDVLYSSELSYAQVYKNRMLMLNLSYSIFGAK